MEIHRLEELSQRVWTIPNALTFLRICLLPFLILCLENSSDWGYLYAIVVGLIMIASDLLDGYLARKLGQSSKIGSILDALSDKIIVNTLALYFTAINKIPIWIPVVFILRDILVGIFAAKLIKNQRSVVRPMMWGRLTSLLAGISFVILVIGIKQLFWATIVASLGMSLYSGVEYFRTFKVVKR